MNESTKLEVAEQDRITESKPKRRVRTSWLIAGTLVVVLLIALVAWLVVRDHPPQLSEAPEAQKVLDVQSEMPFQILIPAYLPKAFNRAEMEIDVNQLGPGGEPMVLLTYRTRKGEALFVREWVPVTPELEVLAASRPVKTKWGNGWFLRQGEGLQAIWVNIGPLRASIYTADQKTVPTEHLLAIADEMGPASNRQVFNFVLNPPELREVPPPPPVEIPINDEGIQEVDLIVTPGGYSPLRFAVKVGVPVRLTFRQLGEVGCGNELIFPADPTNPSALFLESESDTVVHEFTPQTVGEFMFYCSHQMYRGIMTVHE
jgi:hypothetical protein